MNLAALARELDRRSPVLAWFASLFAMLAVAFAVGWLVDGRTVLGINRWIKPFKFAVSISVYLATLGWLLPHVRLSPRLVLVVTWVPIVSMIGEIVGIAGQAFRGTTSHFNIATPFDAAVFSMMGALILANTVAVAVFMAAAWRVRSVLPASYLTGIRLGLLISFLGMNEAWVMIAMNAHTVGLADGGPGLPLVNWNTTAGDLRVAHFVAMHAMQLLPLLGWWLSRPGGVPEPAAVRLVRLSAAAYGGVAAALLLLALAGRPLVPLG